MDILCRRCGEPYDLDEFHELAPDLNTSFDKLVKKFMLQGCKALDGVYDDCTNAPGSGNELVGVLADLSLGDPDGFAADLEDLGLT